MLDFDKVDDIYLMGYKAGKDYLGSVGRRD